MLEWPHARCHLHCVDDVVSVGDINFAECPTDLVGDGISGVS